MSGFGKQNELFGFLVFGRSHKYRVSEPFPCWEPPNAEISRKPPVNSSTLDLGKSSGPCLDLVLFGAFGLGAPGQHTHTHTYSCFVLEGGGPAVKWFGGVAIPFLQFLDICHRSTGWSKGS